MRECPSEHVGARLTSLSSNTAVDSLYRIAVTEGKATSTRRLDGLARFCVAELASRGLHDAVTEAKLPAGPFFDRLVAAVRNRNPVLERAP